MQESRLFKIIYYILDRGQATAPELAEKLEVSVRTIYRDIDALSSAGVPIYTEAGRNGGIRFMNGFVLNRAVLSEEEKQEILTALQSINTAQERPGSQTLQKLSAMFHLDSENWLEVDFSRWGGPGLDNETFALLKSAIVQCRAVRIRYAGCERISERTVQPCRLVYKARSWYLKAFCTEKRAVRIFKLSRIVDLKLLDKTFSRRELPEPPEMPADTCRPVTLRFPKEMAYRVYDEFDRTQIRQQESGDLIVSAEMPEDMWLIGFLLSFGTQVEVLSPACLREELAQTAKLIYEKNKT